MARRLSDLDWPVRTDRLTVRPAGTADAAPMWAYRSRTEVAHWLTTRPRDLEAWEVHQRQRLASQLVIERDGQLVGDLQLDVRDPWSQAEVRVEAAGTVAEIGYIIDPAYAGRGYATEAARALLTIAFARVGVRRVTARCFADNVASWRLMERLGLRREHHGVRDSLHRSGEWLDSFEYALLADEWRAQRG